MSIYQQCSHSQQLRVLFVHRWGAIMAGGEVWIKSLAEHLTTQHVTVAAALHIRGPLYSALEEMNVTVHRAELAFLQASSRRALVTSGAGLIRSAFGLSALIKTDGAELVHAFSPESAEVGLLVSRLARVPLVVTVMNCGPFPSFDGYVLRRSDRVIAISRAVETDLLKLRVSPERIVRIPLGIRFGYSAPTNAGDLRRSLGISTETPLIGMVATLEPKKAHDILLRAVPLVLDAFPTAEFVLLGGDHATNATSIGPYESQLRQLAGSLHISDRVHFLGFRSNAADLIGDLNVSVLCSRKEALGLAAIESLAAGVPLVVTAVEGLQDVVDDGITGLMVPPDTPRALADAIKTMLSNRAFARTMSANGQRLVRERFDAESLVLRNRKVYETVLGKSIQADHSGQTC